MSKEMILPKEQIRLGNVKLRGNKKRGLGLEVLMDTSLAAGISHGDLNLGSRHSDMAKSSSDEQLTTCTSRLKEVH